MSRNTTMPTKREKLSNSMIATLGIYYLKVELVDLWSTFGKNLEPTAGHPSETKKSIGNLFDACPMGSV
jgi:hypothetical protein